MRIEQLEHIEAITRYGSLRKASEHLGISQPALSQSVGRLERELGVPLLERRRTGAKISRRGRDLLAHMVDAIEAVQRLRAAAGDEETATRTVHVGTVQSATSSLLLPALAEFRATNRQVTVEVRHLQQAQIFTELSEGSLDIGLVNLLDGDEVPSDLDQTELLRGKPIVLLPAEHRLNELTEIAVDDLAGEPFVLMRLGYLMNRFVHRWFGPEIGQAAIMADGAELGKAMVAEGLGYSVLPDFTVRGHPLERLGAITIRPLAGDPGNVTLVACRRLGAYQSRPVRELHETLHKKANSQLD